ncbi:hypothetical protein THAOC_12123 [Thalassiosira oceanica]|uniref:Uncharacterized protein n=1 Tax=Thalassiosira oceanica TaxID=159749 RepID=K0SPG9_THAOC|nr:hypothetical protein THAOC_12123 [Thalassiosira oceanica]|eukprot:EJK66904.1 hypothetical protein THAOC_12123 [Thalassiosira oceanica]
MQVLPPPEFNKREPPVEADDHDAKDAHSLTPVSASPCSVWPCGVKTEPADLCRPGQLVSNRQVHVQAKTAARSLRSTAVNEDENIMLALTHDARMDRLLAWLPTQRPLPRPSAASTTSSISCMPSAHSCIDLMYAKRKEVGEFSESLRHVRILPAALEKDYYEEVGAETG